MIDLETVGLKHFDLVFDYFTEDQIEKRKLEAEEIKVFHEVLDPKGMLQKEKMRQQREKHKKFMKKYELVNNHGLNLEVQRLKEENSKKKKILKKEKQKEELESLFKRFHNRPKLNDDILRPSHFDE